MAESRSESERPKSKRPKRDCHFDKNWTREFPGIGASSKGIIAKFGLLRIYALIAIYYHSYESKIIQNLYL